VKRLEKTISLLSIPATTLDLPLSIASNANGRSRPGPHHQQTNRRRVPLFGDLAERR
jgi:hypothetical protein